MTTPPGSTGAHDATSGDRPRPKPHTPVEEEYQRLDESRMWSVASSLITGPVMFGAIGYGLDHLLGTSWLVAVGILAGMALSLYLVWVRYGTQ
jgi:F0F1-type ATP synthase assembly protein I